ncbi:hypothetical protein BDP27DRAFT_1428458 [Rhodocollybia butyracea]|uniref:Uncharacterized protein n=1 Tax=Rhodocollybia butyracea TaxID=206335 RepID=A0A9P5PEV9_9AGAR|nr:hypothetical protein BDP27DRAFT_1428458 [Rhodocollybia butyracea]
MFLITTIFIGIFLEVLVYGVYVATFIRHVRILALRRKKLPPKTFIYLSTASLLLFVIVTVSMVADLIFATHIFKNPAEPIDFSGYGKRRSISIGCCVFSIVISNAILVYRLYILYNSRLSIVALPLSVFVVECGIAIWSVIFFSQKHDVDPWSDHHRRPQKLALAQVIFGFVSGAVNKGQKVLLLPSPSAYARIGAIMINSAAINVVWWLGVFVTSTISSVLYDVCSAPFGCVTALIFSTIIVSASSRFVGVVPSHPRFFSTTSLSPRFHAIDRLLISK